MRRVVKVGGSLLLRPDLKTSLMAWFQENVCGENLVVVGGGELIDSVRRLDRLHHGDPAAVHWQCVDLLEVTLTFVRQSFGWPAIQTPDDLDQKLAEGFSKRSPTLVAVRSFYNRYTQSTVPCDWRTTSDTIAAILAIKVQADELVLLKSCQVDPDADLSVLARSHVVDDALPGIAADVNRIRIESFGHPGRE